MYEINKDFVIFFLLVTLIAITEERIVVKKRSIHVPPPGIKTFQRGSVESPPLNQEPLEKSAAYSIDLEYGSRSLPLRSAVENIPDIIESSLRLPLRDAVEKRPSPDEAYDPSIDFDFKSNINGNSYKAPQYLPLSFHQNSPNINPFFQPFFNHKTLYTSYSHFKGLVSDNSDAGSYKIDNVNHHLIRDPTRARSFNPFLNKFSGEKKLEKDLDDTTKEQYIVCYVQGSAVYRRPPLTLAPSEIDPYACTHLIYAFASIDPHNYNLIPRDEEYEVIQGGFRSVTGLKHINSDLKVLISVGGGPEDGSERFSNMISSSTRRKDFIKSAIDFLTLYEFDGLDIHWQYPGDRRLGGRYSDKENFALLLEELSESLRTEGLLLSIAAPASRFRIEDGFDYERIGEAVDFVTVEAYDFHRERGPVADHHSVLKERNRDNGLGIFYNVDYAVKYWLKKGFPRYKLVLGLPFYGRSFTLRFFNESEIGSPVKGPGREGYYTQTPGLLGYFEVCERIGGGRWVKRDESGVPYLIFGDQWIGYDDPESVELRVLYAKDLNLRGVAVWSLDFDDYKGLCGDKWPLLQAVKRHIKANDPPSTEPRTPSKPTGTCDSNGLYSDPKDCSSYYVCRGGLSYHLSCGSHMLFNPTTGICGYHDTYKCKPGHTIHLPNALKHLDLFPSENIKTINDDKPKVVCYMTNWAFYRKGEGKFVPEHIDQRLCTHVIYAFASLDPETLLMKEFDPWTDLDNDLYARVTDLKDSKVLLSLGGWTDSSGDKYSRLVSNGSNRRKFVIGVVSFLRKHGFKGLHFDWNYPVCWQSNCKKGPASDKPNFTKLMQELYAEFNKQSPPLILAAAISGYKEVIDVSYDLSALGKVLDFISVMTYDYHGSWERKTGHVSPLYSRTGDKYLQYNTNFTMEYLVDNGAPREKLLVGIPFYGQTFTLSRSNKNSIGDEATGPGESGEFTKQPGMLAYYEICNRIKNQRWTVRRESKEMGPYAFYKDQWVGYDDVESTFEKGNYIKNSGFGGAVAWTIDLDDFTNRCCQGSYPLLKSLNRALGLISRNEHSSTDCKKPPEPVTPPPPTLTTGVDTGAASSTEPSWSEDHEHHHTTKTTVKPTTWWTTEKTSKPTTSHWWTTRSTSKKPDVTVPWWVPSTPKPSGTTRRTTTRRTTTERTTTTKRTTTPQWEAEGSTVPFPAVVMPEIPNQPQSDECESGQYFADPNNCNSYFRCVLGELKKQYCAGGLHWNKELGICDWPERAKCKPEYEDEVTYKPTTQSWETTTKRKRPTKRTTIRSTRITTRVTRITTTKPEPTTSSLTNCQTGEYYPHELCNSFYVCVNNQLISQQCAPGLHWNADDSMCDWGYKVKCLGRKKLAQKFKNLAKLTQASGAKPRTPCEAGTFSAYTGDCTQYLHCMWGKYEAFQCAPGLHWNSEKHICDWPENARCTQEENNLIGEDEEIDEVEQPVTPDYKPPKPTRSTTSWSEWTTTRKSSYKPTQVSTTTTTEEPRVDLPPMSGYFKIVCYFTNWAWYRRGVGKYLPEDIDPDLCTHIVYGFAVLDYENLIVKAHDSWADFDNKFYERVVAYKKKGLKVSLALGGWNDSQGDKYSRLVNNPSARAKFIKHVLGFLEKYDFDGLDLDWEYPKCWQVDCKKGPDSDKPAFAAWIKELKEAFRPKGYLLSAAVSPSKTVIDAGYDVPALARYLDWVAVMTYDYHGQWDKQTGHVAPLYFHPDDDVAFFNTNFSINYWISEGVPRRNIVMGMPLYGQSFQLEKEINNGLNAKAPGPGQAGEFTRAAGFLAYYEICDRVKNKGWNVVKDPKKRMGPYAYKGNQWVSYDDKEMIRLKSEFIRKMDLGGGMIWALDLDDFNNRCGEGKHPLLTTIRTVLAASGSGIQEQLGTDIDSSEDEYQEEIKPEEQQKPEEEEGKPSVETGIISEIPHSTTTNPIVDRNSEFKVVCYFTNWAWYRQGVGKYLPSDIDPDLCTHIIYGFAVLNGDQLIIKPHDTWADFDNKFYEKVTAYKAKGIKVLIAIGGWNDSAGDKYSKLVNNPSARRRFISHVLEFIETNNFDGLDLDWEYPKCWQVDCNKGPSSDKQAFADFVRELHGAFQPKGLLLSAAVSPSKRVVDAGYDVPTLSKYLDWIAVMCYDYHGQWDKITGHVAPMYAHPDDVDVTFNTNFTIHYWINQGADRRKIVMGMPMYGQSFSLANNKDNGLNAATYGGGEAGEETRARGFLSYYEICTRINKKGWNLVYDKKNRMGPYAYLRDQWVSFDDINMIRYKSEYIKNMGLGGGMIWALDLDDFKNICDCEEYPLLRTINRVLRNYSVPAPKCKLGGEISYEPTSNSTYKPSTRPPWDTGNDYNKQGKPCKGQLFIADDENCNQYYLCNQGELQLQFCPSGLYWNRDHCDWPENTECHPDATTLKPVSTTTSEISTTEIELTHRPSYPGTDSQELDIESEYKVVCYFTNWAWYRPGDGKYRPEDIDPNLCTHITYGFAVLDPNTLTIKPHDSWADIDNNFYTKVVSHRSRGIKVLIAIGGWNDSLGNKYSRLVNDPQARARFIKHVTEFIEKWGFDGLDLDWEYPKCWQVDCSKGPDSDKQGFADLVKELSLAFKPKGWLLSAAVSPSKTVIDAGYDVPKLSRYFDWIAVMTYDFHGHWDKKTGHVAPLYYYPGDDYDYFNANFSLNYWIELGAPPKKIIMGMPLYGQSFSLADASEHGLNAKSYGPGEAGEFTRAGGFLAFYEICERVKRRSWTVVRDPQGRIGPYAYSGNQWVSYDDIAEIKRKSKLIKELGLGGGMIWALDLDDFRNKCGCGEHPLLKTLNKELRGVSSQSNLINCT